MEAQEHLEEKTIMLIVDGLASGGIERVPMKNLEQLKSQGVLYKEVHLPLAAHPNKSNSYPWSCSIPNPVLMSGTVFIGQKNIKNHLIQHSFKNHKTAFIVNDKAYKDVAQGFDEYINLRSEFEDIFKDEGVFDTTKDVIKEINPSFLRVHIQGTGSSGHKSNEKQFQNEQWYHDIWHTESPYRNQLKKADELIHNFVNWLKEEGYFNQTTLFIFGDHGQANIGGHPPYDTESNKTELLILGKGIKKNIVYEYAEIIDIVPTIAYIHRINPPKYNQGRVLEEIFMNANSNIPEKREMIELNNLLIRANRSDTLAKMMPSNFKSILEIGDWHEDLSPITISNFIKKQQSMIQRK